MYGYICLIVGVVFIGLYFLIFNTHSETIVLTRFNRRGFFSPGWNFGVLTSNAKFIVNKRLRLHIPSTDGYSPDYLRLRAPDGGIIGLRLIITWSYEYSRPGAYEHTHEIEETNSILLTKVQAALNYWIQAKPFPGTAKRALTSLLQAEKTIIERLTGISADALAIPEEIFLSLELIKPVSDLAIQIHEINFIDVQLLERGTDAPDWGDNHFVFDAEKVRLRLRQRVNSVSDLRKEMILLREEFPEEADYIESLYDEERIRSMEHRDH